MPRFLPLCLFALAASRAWGQDVYYSQAFANRQAQNPAWIGILDDYSGTLTFRNQFPQLAGTFETVQAGGEWRIPKPGLHQAVGVLIAQDRTGAVGYTRLQASAQYAYHTRLTRDVALSGGASLGYGRQRVGYDNFTFGDQYGADGTYQGATAEQLAGNYPAQSFLLLGVGAVLYADNAWLSVAGQNLTQPDLGFRGQSRLPLSVSVSAGYKLFVQRPVGTGVAERREISFVPTATYTRQGSSQRTEGGLYFIARPITLGALLRNIVGPGSAHAQQVAVAVAGVEFGDFRLGYAYDVGLSALAADLGGAHEITLTIRAFDKLESAFRRLKRRAYPAAPCPSF